MFLSHPQNINKMKIGIDAFFPDFNSGEPLSAFPVKIFLNNRII
jgi:hypothetical protein